MSSYRKRNSKKNRKIYNYRYPLKQPTISLKANFYTRGYQLGLSDSTIYRYWRWTRRLILFYSEPIHPSSLTDEAVLTFVRHIKGSDLSSSTIFQCIDSIKFLYTKVLTPRPSLLNQLSKIREKNSVQKAPKNHTAESPKFSFIDIFKYLKLIYAKIKESSGVVTQKFFACLR